ncbi:MAG: winged helix-turn-helix domain-containing protein [Rhodospirillales bacterium]
MFEVAMPVIRISDTTLDRLKKVAIPLEDTVDSVINRLLDNYVGSTHAPGGSSPPQSASKPGRTSRKKKLPQNEFEEPLMETIYELGKSADVRDVREPLYEKIKNRLLEGDHDPVSTGEPRWWNAACWARHALKEKGLMKSDSARGVWELTDKGIEYVEAHRG